MCGCLRHPHPRAPMTNKIIYTRKIAMKLIEMGNIPVGTTPNPSKPEFLCWIFSDTPKFQSDLGEILPNGKISPKNDKNGNGD